MIRRPQARRTMVEQTERPGGTDPRRPSWAPPPAERRDPDQERVNIMATYQLHTDGACSGNPGPGGFAGIIIRDSDGDRVYVTGHDPRTTNNRMELCAVLEGLRVISEMDHDGARVQVYSDSQYLTKAFNDNWLAGWQRNGWRTSQKKPVLNQDLWQELLTETKKVDASFIWVKGHAGNALNEEADRLAVAESNFARNSDGYRVSVGTPCSVAAGQQEGAPWDDPEEGQTTSQPQAAPPNRPTDRPTAEALIDAVIDEACRATNFGDFQRRLINLRTELKG